MWKAFGFRRRRSPAWRGWISPAWTAPRSPVFSRPRGELVRAYAAKLSESGAAVSTTDFPGYGDLYLETTINHPPHQLFGLALTWLQETFEASAPADLPVAALRTDHSILRPPGAVERVVTFGENLRGVLCEPDHAVSGGPTVLFCNTGGDPRAGSGGFASGTARRLARQGLTSLRFDFAGQGDSPMRGEELRSHVFETPREDDMDAAVEFLAVARLRGRCGRRDLLRRLPCPASRLEKPQGDGRLCRQPDQDRVAARRFSDVRA